jgi:peptidoglycan/xylan/chitin deacetylase (PgdA/CDA1 family)
MRRVSSVAAAGLLWAALACRAQPCNNPVYLTFDTGHMGVAPLVAEVLQRQQVKVTFFLADERTVSGGTSLDEQWAPWWRARAAEGHAFGSHTHDHVYWQADAPDGGFMVRPSAGPQEGQRMHWSAPRYCKELDRSAQRFQEMTGQPMAHVFRAPGGKVSPALIAATHACGYQHVPWTPAGFLGDELSSERWPNQVLLAKALRDIRPGDILLAHLGIWSRHDAWAPAVLEPLIVGLKAKGMCFATLRDHPNYRAAFAAKAAGTK